MPDDLRWSWCNDDRKWTINVVNLNHPQTIPFPWSVEKFCLSRNRSLMPKRLGTTALLDQEVGCCLLSYSQREEMEILPSSSLWLLISFYSLASSDILSGSVFLTVSPELAGSLRKLFSCFSDFRSRAQMSRYLSTWISPDGPSAGFWAQWHHGGPAFLDSSLTRVLLSCPLFLFFLKFIYLVASGLGCSTRALLCRALASV